MCGGYDSSCVELIVFIGIGSCMIVYPMPSDIYPVILDIRPMVPDVYPTASDKEF